MSGRIAGVPVIAVEPDRRCTACGKVDECRPYGKGGAQVCFDCAMATPESKAEAERQMGGVVPLYGWLPFATLRERLRVADGVGLRMPGCLDPRCERCWVDVDGEDDE